MSLCQNSVNCWEVNHLNVNGGDAVQSSVDVENDRTELTVDPVKGVVASINIEPVVAFRCSLANLFSYFFPLFNESTEIAPIHVIRGVTVYVDPTVPAELRFRDWSDADEVRVDVNIWEPVGISFDNYVKTTFYPMYAKGDMSCSVTIRRPINPELFLSTSSMIASSALKQWCYYISNTSNVQATGTVGVVSEVVIDGKTSMRAMGSLITDNNGVQIRNNSEMDGGVGDIYVNGYLKLDLHSDDCCVYPEAQTEEDIDCDGNEIRK